MYLFIIILIITIVIIINIYLQNMDIIMNVEICVVKVKKYIYNNKKRLPLVWVLVMANHNMATRADHLVPPMMSQLYSTPVEKIISFE